MLRTRKWPTLGQGCRGRAAARSDPGAAGGQLLRLRLPADVEDASSCRRAGATLPRAAADEDQRDPGREAARQAVAHHQARSEGRSAARSRPARLQRIAAERALGRRSLLAALLGRTRLLRVRDRRLQPQDRRLATRDARAYRPRPRRTEAGARPARTRRRRRADPSLRPGLAVHEHRLRPDPRRPSPRSPRSVRSATPSTTRSPNRSSTASRPSSSLTASGEHAPSSSSRSSSTSAGSTNARLHESLGDIPPAEHEQPHADRGPTTLVGATAQPTKPGRRQTRSGSKAKLAVVLSVAAMAALSVGTSGASAAHCVAPAGEEAAPGSRILAPIMCRRGITTGMPPAARGREPGSQRWYLGSL